MYFNIASLHKLGRWLYLRKVPVLPRLFDMLIFVLFNSKVPLTCEIGVGTVFSHRGIAVVLHPRASVGKRCVIGTSVVLGGLGKGKRGAPCVGDDVYIGTGAKILGPVKVGNGATIGANAVVIADVPENATVGGIPARILNARFNDFADF